MQMCEQPKKHYIYEFKTRSSETVINWLNIGEISVIKISYTLREHLRAYKAVLYLSHSFLYLIGFIHELYVQISTFV